MCCLACHTYTVRLFYRNGWYDAPHFFSFCFLRFFFCRRSIWVPCPKPFALWPRENVVQVVLTTVAWTLALMVACDGFRSYAWFYVHAYVVGFWKYHDNDYEYRKITRPSRTNFAKRCVYGTLSRRDRSNPAIFVLSVLSPPPLGAITPPLGAITPPLGAITPPRVLSTPLGCYHTPFRCYHPPLGLDNIDSETRPAGCLVSRVVKWTIRACPRLFWTRAALD